MRLCFAALIWLLLIPAAPVRTGSIQAKPPAPHQCGWAPPVTAHVLKVGGVRELMQALDRLKPGTTILLENGEYRLDRTVELSVSGTVLRSRSGDPSAVVLRGLGMTSDPVGVAVAVNAPDVTIADITIKQVRYHAIQVRGELGPSRPAIHNVHLMDTGQQLLKGSISGNGRYADDGLVACSRFEYTSAAPSDYTDGVDLLGAKGWVIRDNTFHRIRGPERDGWRAGPAILVWANSQDTLIERNLIIDSFRGIAIGLSPGGASFTRDGEKEIDHRRGVIRNNVVCNLNEWADEAIEANASTDFRIDHNTVLTLGTTTPWTIGIRFPVSHGLIRNNLTSRPALQRNGARAEFAANVSAAMTDWFADARTCDLHLTTGGRGAIDVGVEIADLPIDYDRQPRVGKPDVGAFEYRGVFLIGGSR